MSLSNDPNWWRQAAVYQIYPRSFADSNGDGIGDLKGITSRVDYLKSLHLDAVWISPFYPSALVDGGYDVDDFMNVDPKLGTLDDFDEMLTALHDAGIRVFIDIVANHSSNRHTWFQQAINAAPGSPERDRYIFRDGRGEHGELPPTDWISHFAPSAWTHESVMGGKHNQWYMHWFAPEQPDFNWDNDDVAEYFRTTLRFWADRGVDGFRIDVAHGLKKDLSEPLRMLNTLEDSVNRPVNGEGVLADRNEVFDVYRDWRKIFNEYTPPKVAVAEANVLPHRVPLYASPETLGQSFDFRFLRLRFDPNEFRTAVTDALTQAAGHGSSSTWTLMNHDRIRHVTRYGLHPTVNSQAWLLSNGTSNPLDWDAGINCGLAATLFILGLPGSTYLYQGEELGLHEVTDIPEDQIQDPQYLKNNKQKKGRDGCRVPLPWTRTGTSYGFGPAGAHLPQPAWFADYSVEAETGVPWSPLTIYRDALALRRDLQADETLTWHETGNTEVLHYSRANGWHCVTNFRGEPHPLPEGELLMSSRPLTDGKIGPATTVWLKR